MRKLSISIILYSLMLWFSSPAFGDELLEPDDAFQLTSTVKGPSAVVLSWDIADGYYLYRHKVKFASLTPGMDAGSPAFPAGQPKHDKFFGDVEIFRDRPLVELPVQRKNPQLRKFNLEVTYQGCADMGVCYLPIKKEIVFELPEANAGGAGSVASGNPPPFMSEQDQIAASLTGGSMGLIFLSFVGFGLLLSFTPCVFPMIPILSGIVVGQGPGITAGKAFALSLSYVLASALTYTFFGVLAGLFGSNLQAFFQEPWVIVVFSAVFILLAFSMFGLFTFQIPSFIQSRIVVLSARQRGGNLLGAAVMGMLSALAIGPCVTAPLAGALIYIGQSGDAVLGGAALFALGLGMGIPMLIIGTSAGKLLPKTGAWMHVTKTVFGVGLLAVAVWLLGRILPPKVSLLLWASLLVVPLMYLGLKKLWKGVVLVSVTYGVLLLVGLITHQQRDYMQFLCNTAIACQGQPSLPFQKIVHLAELRQNLAEAQANKQWAMLDFYADWCISCQEMEQLTFSDPEVRAALSQMHLIQADVTQNDESAQSLLKQFDLIGPPAILFFGPDQLERKSYRIIGYVDSEKFLARLHQVIR